VIKQTCLHLQKILKNMQPTKLFLNILLALMMTACDRSCSDGLEPLTERISCGTSVSENEGTVFLTKYDTINNIVSGTFEFTSRCAGWVRNYETKELAYPNTDSVFHITSGRFDIKIIN
jgi:hypothetical protein